jgi:multidrug efflux pump subunit AcrA (membrane-fusion protein)
MSLITGTGNSSIHKKRIMNVLLKLFCFILLISGFLSCGGKAAAPAEEETAPQTVTPVTVDSAVRGPVAEYIELNAISSFLKKNSVKSSAAGYINQVAVSIGEPVKKDQELFILKTKEASALDNYKTMRDSAFLFSGMIRIRSFQDGIISSFNRHVGDYVVEGDELCVVSDRTSFVFLLDVPFELSPFVRKGSSCEILLPDKEIIRGTIETSLPSMDVNSQTESVVVKPLSTVAIPENLIARIRILKNKKDNALTLPKGAILSNETQTDFWVMKLINDSTAVKVPVSKGMETQERTEILAPSFLPSDRIVISGNYGLADTARVSINEAHP